MRRDSAQDRWPELMRQLLDSAAARGNVVPSAHRPADDVVMLATHAMEWHASRAQVARTTAAGWRREGQLGMSTHTAVPITGTIGTPRQAPLPAERHVDRTG